ncbi:MAG: hypothetical protein GX335_02495 [Firmicutes bacterium]|nr:hypothetical protein [Bacillota bacterium]
MNSKLFLGVADNNQTATAVVGDSRGNVIAASRGGSVNFHFHQPELARQNFKNLISETIGWRKRKKLKMVSFTYKSNFAEKSGNLCYLVQGVLEEAEIQTTDFVTTCTLGVPGKERMVLMGGQTGVVVYDDFAGLRFRLCQQFLVRDLFRRIFKKIENESGAFGLRGLLQIIQDNRCVPEHDKFATAALSLNRLAEKGNPLALEIITDIAHELIRLVVKMARHMQVLDPVIGLYGKVLLDCTLVLEKVCSVVTGLYPGARLQAAPLAPAKGAYLSSLLAKKLEIDEQVITNLESTSNNLGPEPVCGLEMF